MIMLFSNGAIRNLYHLTEVMDWENKPHISFLEEPDITTNSLEN